MIIPYEDKYEGVWDTFVLKESINGNFLQTRNFYNYHAKDKFKDASVLFMKNDKIAAVLPANVIDNSRTLIAHQGSTFGGIVIGRAFANTNGYNWIFKEMVSHFIDKKYERVELRMHNWLYSPDIKRNELCEYYFQLYGFSVRSEIGFYIDLSQISENYTSRFEKLKKRKLNKAQKCNLTFKKLSTDEQVREFYTVLMDNMIKFNTVPVHSVDEILDFKNNRLPEVVSFYGVYYEEKMIAGSMVFNFCDKKVFHTQYLASRQDYLEYCPNEFLYANLIQAAIDEGYGYLSYGTASLEHGMIYNESLGQYKEGFNTDSYMNRCYIWTKENLDARY